MSDEPRYFRLGLFAVLGATLLVGAIIAFGGGQFFRPKAYAETYVNGSVQGIDPGTPVKFRGVQIGRVKSVDFTFNLYDIKDANQAHNYVVIIMEIDRPVSPGFFDSGMRAELEKNIRDGLRVSIEPLGITGLNYLDFGYFEPGRFPPLQVDWKPHNFYVPYAPGQITSFLDSINKIMREVEDFNIDEFTKSGTELLDNLNKSVLDAQLGKVSQDLRDLVARIDTTVQSADIPAVSADLRKLIDGISTSNSKLEKILANLEPASRLEAAQIKDIIANTDSITKNLLALSEEVRQRPSILIWGGKPPAPKPLPSPSPSQRKKQPKP